MRSIEKKPFLSPTTPEGLSKHIYYTNCLNPKLLTLNNLKNRLNPKLLTLNNLKLLTTTC
jgi:hypothetical protein